MRFTGVAKAPTIGAMNHKASAFSTLDSTVTMDWAFSLNLKYPFGLSLSKPRAALRQAQRERFQWIHAE